MKEALYQFDRNEMYSIFVKIRRRKLTQHVDNLLKVMTTVRAVQLLRGRKRVQEKVPQTKLKLHLNFKLKGALAVDPSLHNPSMAG